MNTDHDETLKEQIEFSINNSIEKGIIGDPQLALDIALDEVMQLILQDRERAVREARIKDYKTIFGDYGEFNLLDDVIVYSHDKSRLYHNIVESEPEEKESNENSN